MRPIDFVFFAICFGSLAINAYANLPSHTHGEGSLNLAFDSTEGLIEFRADTQSLYGFEYEPRTEQEKQKKKSVLSFFENSFADAVSFPKDKLCKIEPIEVKAAALSHSNQHHEHDHDQHRAEHRDLEAKYKVQCEEKVHGAKVKIDLSRFKNLHTLRVSVLSDEVQASFELEQAQGEIQF